MPASFVRVLNREVGENHNMFKHLRTFALNGVRIFGGYQLLKVMPFLFPLIAVGHLFAIILIDKYTWHKPFFSHKRMIWNFLLLIANITSAIISIEVHLFIGSLLNGYVALAGLYIFRN